MGWAVGQALAPGVQVEADQAAGHLRAAELWVAPAGMFPAPDQAKDRATAPVAGQSAE
jgi:hypothetical protein